MTGANPTSPASPSPTIEDIIPDDILAEVFEHFVVDRVMATALKSTQVLNRRAHALAAKLKIPSGVQRHNRP